MANKPGTRKPHPQKKKKKTTVRRSSGGVMFLALVFGIALVFVVALAVLHPGRGTKPAAGGGPSIGQAVPQSIVTDLTSIPASVFNRIGAQGAQKPILVPEQPITGKVPILYVGAEYCPYCAAARWSMITALSRFGKFTGLELMRSSSTDYYANTPTFSLQRAHYASRYIDFQAVEQSTRTYQPLERLTRQQAALLQQFDAPPYVPASAKGDIPFLLVGHRYLFAGSPYVPTVLDGRSWGAIAATLPKGSGRAAKAILTNANELSAAICALTGGKPSNVCQSPAVKSAAPSLQGTVP